ncbi:MAG: sugar phosphate isomerase/epimerase [Candidatus Lokiarchaeota archaeon]|nr:sugar phosphate isomerase/epimerase [Candidatus Lokiarchaeota archaeon]
MKLGISSLGYIINYGKSNNYNSLLELILDSTRNCLNDAEEYNLDVCEIVLEPPVMMSKDNVPLFIELCNSYSIEKQIHSPFVDISLCSFNEDITQASISSYKKSAKITEKIGATLLTIHPGFGNFLIEPIRKYNQESLRKNVLLLLDSIKDMNISICIENMPKMVNIFLNTDEIIDFFHFFNKKKIYLTYDTSHFWTCEGDLSYLWEKLSTRIKNIHLVDNFDREKDPHPQLGCGKINFDHIFQYLKEYQYKDSLIIELSNSKDIPKSINFIRKYIY